MNYVTLRYFDNNLSRRSKQAEVLIFCELYIDEVIRGVHRFIDQTVYR